MRRLIATVYAIFAIIFVLFIMTQAANIGVPWEFNLVIVGMIVIIVIGVIRTWLRH